MPKSERIALREKCADEKKLKELKDRDYYYPIPIKERILTNGALKQNPGWIDGLGF